MLTAFVVWTLLASLITACLYIWDKSAARNKRPRIPEVTLLTWSALGGWPGAWIAGSLIRHKNRKPSYQLKFILVAAAHVVVVGAAWYLTSGIVK